LPSILRNCGGCAKKKEALVMTRSFCYVDDLIDGLTRLMATPANVTGPVNIGNPTEFRVIELVQMTQPQRRPCCGEFGLLAGQVARAGAQLRCDGGARNNGAFRDKNPTVWSAVSIGIEPRWYISLDIATFVQPVAI
jgi:hypothetical protein